MAVWELGLIGTGQYSVRANRYIPGAGWGVAEQISDWGDVSYGSVPELGVDRFGSAIVVWNTHYDGRHATYANRFTERFGWGIVEHIDDTNPDTNDQTSMDVAVDVDQQGRAIAVWRRGMNADRDLWANRFDESPCTLPSDSTPS